MQTARVKILPLLEVLVVFAAAILLFRVIAASPLHAWAGYSPLEYAAVLLLVLGLIWLARRGFARCGVAFPYPRFQLTIILAGFLPFLALGASLSFLNWHTWQGALLVSLVSLAVLWVVALALHRRLPPQVLSLGAWLVFFPAPAVLVAAPSLGAVLVKTLYVYLLVGPAEELLFRGYIQSRLNAAWGRPFRFYGQAWGAGLLVAAALFGLWHVALMPTAAGIWGQVLWTACVGLALGYVREKSGSILPSALLHSLMNYFPLVDLLGG